MDKKKFKPVYTVDITKCSTEKDVLDAFCLAKMKAFFTTDQKEHMVNDIINDSILIACDAMVSLFGDYNTIHFDGEDLIRMNLKKYDIEDDEKFECDAQGVTNIVKVKKPNVFKRFWNWITRKK